MALGVKEVQEMYETAVRRMMPRWDFMLMCYDALVGRQWTQSEEEYFEKHHITMRTFNVLHSQIVTLDGVQIGSMQLAKTYPVEPGDFDISDVLTEVMQHELRETNADDVLRSVTMDAAIAGWGWMYKGFRKTPRYIDGQIVWERLNGFDCLADLDDENPSIMLDMWRGITRWGTSGYIGQTYGHMEEGLSEEIRGRALSVFGPEEVEKQNRTFWSSFQRAISNLGSVLNSRNKKVRSTDPWDKKSNDYIDKTAGMLRTIEIHYRVQATRLVIIDPDATEPIQIPEQYQEDTQENREVIGQALASLGLDESAVREHPFEEWRQCAAVPGLMSDELLFDTAYTVQGRGCAIDILEAFNYDLRKNERGSVVSLALDAQRRMNRAMSLQEEWVKRRQFPDVIAAKGQIPVEELQTWKSHEMGRVLLWDPQGNPGMQPPRFNDAPGAESLINLDFSINLDLIPRLTGVPLALAGEKDAKKDGADLYQSMVAQAQTLMRPLMQQVQTFYKNSCGYTLDTIQRHYTAKRWIRTTGKKGVISPESGGFYINDWDYMADRPINDLDIGRYDVVVDTGPLTPAQRELKFRERVQFLGAFDPLLREFSFPELLELSGWSDAPELLRKWRVVIKFKYAPYGDILLQMLEDEDAFANNMQNGSIDNAVLAGLRDMLMQTGGNGLGDMRSALSMRGMMNGGVIGGGAQPNPADNMLPEAAGMSRQGVMQ
ncbi:MAG TPA: hypothetical protein PK916_08930 [Bacteroidota bacterium]|nr:hypothetical protein [Bacteroidota bacterium]